MSKPTPTGRIIVDFLNRNFPAYVDTGLNLVDVAEVARMHVVALERGTPGERYILGGENLTLKQILDRMSAITGLPSPTIKVPHAVAMAFAFFDENFTGQVAGKEPRATVEAVRMGKKIMFASSARRSESWAFKYCRSTMRCEPRSTGLLRMDMRRHWWTGGMKGNIAIIAALEGELGPLVRSRRSELEAERIG